MLLLNAVRWNRAYFLRLLVKLLEPCLMHF